MLMKLTLCQDSIKAHSQRLSISVLKQPCSTNTVLVNKHLQKHVFLFTNA